MRQYTLLNRRGILIQIKDDRNSGCQAVVPVHPAVLQLPRDVLHDERYAREALQAASVQYDEDVRGYVDALRRQRGEPDPSLELDKFEKFDKAWLFEFSECFEPLGILWHGVGDEFYEMHLVPLVVVNTGALSPDGSRVVSVEEAEMSPNISIIYGTTRQDDILLLPKEVMLEYETRNPLARAAVHNENGDAVELTVSAMCSDYLQNVPQAVLFRNWAVEYNNRLLAAAEAHGTN